MLPTKTAWSILILQLSARLATNYNTYTFSATVSDQLSHQWNLKQQIQPKIVPRDKIANSRIILCTNVYFRWEKTMWVSKTSTIQNFKSLPQSCNVKSCSSIKVIFWVLLIAFKKLTYPIIFRKKLIKEKQALLQFTTITISMSSRWHQNLCFWTRKGIMSTWRTICFWSLTKIMTSEKHGSKAKIKTRIVWMRRVHIGKAISS